MAYLIKISGTKNNKTKQWNEIKSFPHLFPPHSPFLTSTPHLSPFYTLFLYTFSLPPHREELDGSSFQGRLLHIINSKKAPEIIPQDLEKGKVKLSSFQQKKEDDRRKMANKTEGWNASFVRSDAVVDSLAERWVKVKVKVKQK